MPQNVTTTGAKWAYSRHASAANLRPVRLDTHQHFWPHDPAQHVWMTEAMGVLRRDHLPADLEPSLGAAGFDGTIAVQARQMVEETEWLLQLADAHPFIRGVVGWVDLRSPQVGDQLARYARHPKLVGVRHVVHDEPEAVRDGLLHGLEVPFPVLLDLERRGYAAWGMRRSSVAGVWLDPRVWARYAGEVARGQRLLRLGVDTLQLGGDFVVDRTGIRLEVQQPAVLALPFRRLVGADGGQ